jgi:two-component system sensor histidine kinase SenX3
LITASADPKVVVVQVADNGVGIPESQFERVFDRFFRGEEPDLHNIPGTGLGLYISRHLAEEHGGSLKIVKSRIGEGTVFGLTLPVMEAAAVDQADPPRPPRNGVRRSSRQAGVR